MLLTDPIRYGMALARAHLKEALRVLPAAEPADTARGILPSLIRDFDAKIGDEEDCGGYHTEGCRCGAMVDDDSEMPYRFPKLDGEPDEKAMAHAVALPRHHEGGA